MPTVIILLLPTVKHKVPVELGVVISALELPVNLFIVLLKLLKVLDCKVSVVIFPINVSVILGKVILALIFSVGYKLVWCDLSVSYIFMYPATPLAPFEYITP